MTGLLTLLLHGLLMLAAAPILVGLVRRMKARLVGRSGPAVLQPWRDLSRLLRKQPVVAEGTSIVLRAAPPLILASTFAALLLIPSFAFGMATASVSDLVVIAGLLTLGRCALALAAMDTGTAFGGIGASREMMFAVFAEPVFVLVVFTLTLLAGTSNLDAIASLLGSGALGLRISLALVLAALMAVALAESGRIPIDNPATHLELTRVHEAMVLEYSGRHLALIEMAAALKLLLWLSLISALFAPVGVAEPGFVPLGWVIGLAAWGLKIGLLAVALAVFETTRAKMRVFRVPEFLGVAMLLALLAAVLLFVSQGFA
jgi:formate hydrogenlyase subunit 4